MSVRRGAPYEDRHEEEGRLIIYEGHDIPRTSRGPDPKKTDQTERGPKGGLTQNGLFARAAKSYREGRSKPERVRVYEKIQTGIWVYNGLFELVDVWQEQSGGRKIFKFKLQLAVQDDLGPRAVEASDEDRVIPTKVKLEVWKRDRGCCVMCGAKSGLHFDHIIPYSKGGSSKDPLNIQILCSRHNLEKADNIR